METHPPVKREFSANVNQWIIYDKYMQHEETKEIADENEAKNEDDPPMRRKFLDADIENEKEEMNKKMIRCARILERMVNQNNYDEIATGHFYFKSHVFVFKLMFIDYCFYEDAADNNREFEGTLLPLWKFEFAEAKELEITALCWNPVYSDLFAAAFGSCE